ncbi:16S rRNA pseudouridine(516) synthase [Sporanaerobium hydrogeniformans]|uniref:16S rRNA pseudouridine(516) synthase n=2 Tax=Sporanaerobium hydrogeniformans TaxID=3072179 RepID=A0AC61DGP2_9FIRM|nr:16S rRNA pseudouridine(516) synthase [Sporanaerobium hydrogeniformans]
MRLDRFLVHTGYGSRSEVQKLVKQGKVTVKGEVIKKSDTSINVLEDEVKVRGENVSYQEFYYYILYKPAGYITATEDLRQETVLDLLDPIDRNKGLCPVGRLDKDTEGLLILTNDGQLNHALLSPKKHVDKVYYAKLEGEVGREDIERFREGLTLEDGTKLQPAELEIIKTGAESEVHVTIREGKFHQVKRMALAVGKKVIYLKRIQMGRLSLPSDLEPGAYRPLTSEELEQLSK